MAQKGGVGPLHLGPPPPGQNQRSLDTLVGAARASSSARTTAVWPWAVAFSSGAGWRAVRGMARPPPPSGPGRAQRSGQGFHLGCETERRGTRDTEPGSPNSFGDAMKRTARKGLRGALQRGPACHRGVGLPLQQGLHRPAVPSAADSGPSSSQTHGQGSGALCVAGKCPKPACRPHGSHIKLNVSSRPASRSAAVLEAPAPPATRFAPKWLRRTGGWAEGGLDQRGQPGPVHGVHVRPGRQQHRHHLRRPLPAADLSHGGAEGYSGC